MQTRRFRRFRLVAPLLLGVLLIAPGARAMTGDLDGSGLVDGWDLINFALSFGSKPGDANWRESSDFDQSGVVDGNDLATLVANFGRSRSFDSVGLPSHSGPRYLPDQIVVKFSSALGTDAIRERAGALGGTVRSITPHFVTVGISTSTGDTVESAVQRFQADPDVIYAEPDYLRYLHFRPNDPYFVDQWNLGHVDYQSGEDVQNGSAPGVTVAVIDTGIAYEQYGTFRKATDLAGTRFVAGPDLVDNDGHPNDEGGDGFGHGTFVATVIAATTNNSFGMAGIAFNATLMPIRVFPKSGGTSDSRVAQAIDAAVSGGARIINMSLGGPDFSNTLQSAVQRAYAAGATMVASSGNEAEDSDWNRQVDYPAGFPEVIAVGATDLRGVRASYSNFGSTLDVVAPGGDNNRDDNNDGEPDGVIGQAFQGGNYTNFQFFYGQGTSFSAPHVTALAAMLYARGVTNPEAIRNTILYTARGDGSRNNDVGFGLVSIRKALEGLGPT